jgi:catechol 1,2-dioxygenase
MSDASYEAETTAKAAESGNKATERFLQNTAFANVQADQARISRIASRVIKAMNDAVIEEEVTYDEYNILKAWLIKMGNDGEWPLFLDVWLEHSVEEVHNSAKKGTKGTIEAPTTFPTHLPRTPLQPSRSVQTSPVPH